MTDFLADTAVQAGSGLTAHDVIREALMESRQRWQQLVSLAADLAFETDAQGRFVFVIPDNALGWPARSLIGQPSELLVGDDGTGEIFNPFRPTQEVRRHRAWLRRRGGGLAMISISAAPLFDAQGAIIGARGIGIDMTEPETQTSQIAGRLRRGEALDHILSRVSQEADTDRMMEAALWTLIHALGAEGAAVVGASAPEAPVELLHECGPGALAVLTEVTRMDIPRLVHPDRITGPDGRHVIAVSCETKSGVNVGLVVWRNAAARPWDEEDTLMAGSAKGVIRMILEYEAVQREMALQARTDPLTGLLNRRAFLEEIQRHLARLDRESGVGRLMFVDLDGFKQVNDDLGHAAGDDVLMALSAMLQRLVRPSDVVARVGGDEFAVWLSGADQMTAAERADLLCRAAPVELQAVLPKPVPGLGVSIGIAMREAGSGEPIDSLNKRADMAMYEVKRTGRGFWRASLLESNQ